MAVAAVADAPKATRKPRDPNAPKREVKPRKVYMVVQVLGADGEPVKIEKGSLKVLAVVKNSETVLEMLDSGNFPHALYLAGTVPPGR